MKPFDINKASEIGCDLNNVVLIQYPIFQYPIFHVTATRFMLAGGRVHTVKKSINPKVFDGLELAWGYGNDNTLPLHKTAIHPTLMRGVHYGDDIVLVGHDGTQHTVDMNAQEFGTVMQPYVGRFEKTYAINSVNEIGRGLKDIVKISRPLHPGMPTNFVLVGGKTHLVKESINPAVYDDMPVAWGLSQEYPGYHSGIHAAPLRMIDSELNKIGNQRTIRVVDHEGMTCIVDMDIQEFYAGMAPYMENFTTRVKKIKDPTGVGFDLNDVLLVSVPLTPGNDFGKVTLFDRTSPELHAPLDKSLFDRLDMVWIADPAKPGQLVGLNLSKISSFRYGELGSDILYAGNSDGYLVEVPVPVDAFWKAMAPNLHRFSLDSDTRWHAGRPWDSKIKTYGNPGVRASSLRS